MRAGGAALRAGSIRAALRPKSSRPRRRWRARGDRHGLLRRFALSEMSLLHRLIVGSGHAVALAAPDGMILDVLSDQRFESLPHVYTVRPRQHLGRGALRHQWRRDRPGLEEAAHRLRPRALFREVRRSDMHGRADHRAGRHARWRPRRLVRPPRRAAAHPGAHHDGRRADRERADPRAPSRRRDRGTATSRPITSGRGAPACLRSISTDPCSPRMVGRRRSSSGNIRCAGRLWRRSSPRHSTAFSARLANAIMCSS